MIFVASDVIQAINYARTRAWGIDQDVLDIRVHGITWVYLEIGVIKLDSITNMILYPTTLNFNPCFPSVKHKFINESGKLWQRLKIPAKRLICKINATNSTFKKSSCFTSTFFASARPSSFFIVEILLSEISNAKIFLCKNTTIYIKKLYLCITTPEHWPSLPRVIHNCRQMTCFVSGRCACVDDVASGWWVEDKSWKTTCLHDKKSRSHY